MKNLEKEYRQLTADNMPDLWDRIEAGIDKLESEKVIEIENVKEETNATEKVVTFDKNRRNIYLPSIAAVAILLITCSAYFSMNRSIKSNTAATADYAPMEATASEEAMCDEAPVEATEAYVDEAPTETREAYVEEACEEAVAEDFAYETNDEMASTAEADVVYTYYGKLEKVDDDYSVISCSIDGDEDITRIYVPEESRSIVASAILQNQEVYIEYVLLNDELYSSLDEDFSDVIWCIDSIKLQ